MNTGLTRAPPVPVESQTALQTLEVLSAQRQAVSYVFRAMTSDMLSCVYYPAHDTDYPAEGWTARKVLRRIIEHEFEHMAQIRALI